ncbi:MAG: YraN family protein [Acidobacteriota bacterium]|nr:YraN family protein [Acidobacteriota bacterium]
MAKKHNESFETGSSRIGAFGEGAAAEYLRVRGYEIIARNFSTVIGRNRKGVALKGEIDIIARLNETICFIEVKTRSGPLRAPETAVNLKKRRQIARTARTYLKLFDLNASPVRFDVLTVLSRDTKSPSITHFQKYWTPEAYSKIRWVGDRFFLE